MTVRELREKYQQFFESKGHMRFPSASLVPYDVTGKLDESLLFTGAGMVQFKPYFRGIAQPQSQRLITCQKCVRTGDIESVGDPSHLTFFEMLGNFSFGDYFKSQAVSFSWEFLTSKEWLGLDKNRLAFTVFEEDDEAYVEWERWLRAEGIDPETRIFRLSEETNYWPAGAFSAGPPGPCGPNSEMFYWVPNDEPPPSGRYTKEDYLRDDAAGKWLEIWNDVFIQFEWQGHLKNPDRPGEGYVKDAMPPLPFRSVDTGMGLERTVTTLNGMQSAYQTDAFTPIFQKLAEIAFEVSSQSNDPRSEIRDPSFSPGRPHRPSATSPTRGGGDVPVPVVLQAMAQGLIPEDERVVRAARVIADHIRTAVFCIADGVVPENTGRGYVLKRLIRRAVLKGQRVLGLNGVFLYRLYEPVAETMAHQYPELRDHGGLIVQTLQREEEQFQRTLRSGSAMLQEELNRLRHGSGKPVLAGPAAFRLYDTYGFPLEVTQELAAEAGVEVDLEGFEQAMRQAQEISAPSTARSPYERVNITLVVTGEPVMTQFTGYEELQSDAHVIGALGEPGKELVLALDRTPFYLTSGGQVSDTGRLLGDGFDLHVDDMGKQQGFPVHVVKETHGLDPEELLGKRVRAEVDMNRRARIRRNHTATHLLHAALRQVLGKHVVQRGSYVGPDRLRFDFAHGQAMTPAEVMEVERIVNERVLENRPVLTYVDIPIEEAKAMGAMALFGEKYSDRVRLVQIGDEAPDCPSFSRELCGGTHVRSTGEIGLFKIIAEGSAAGGIRRIEALTGEGSYEWAQDLGRQIREAAAALKANPSDLVLAAERAQEQVRDLNRRLERLRSQSASGSSALIKPVGPVELAVEKVTEGELKDATLVADRLAHSAANRVVMVGLASDGKAAFVCKVGPEALAKGAHAGNLVREVAKIAGGGGGGRPDFATAGGKQVEKVDEALSAAEGLLAAMVGS